MCFEVVKERLIPKRYPNGLLTVHAYRNILCVQSFAIFNQKNLQVTARRHWTPDLDIVKHKLWPQQYYHKNFYIAMCFYYI